MTKKLINMTKKASKIAGVTCVAAGAVALVASGAAVKAVIEGGKYLKDTVEKIVNSESEPKETETEAQAEETAVGSVAAEEDVQKED